MQAIGKGKGFWPSAALGKLGRAWMEKQELGLWLWARWGQHSHKMSTRMLCRTWQMDQSALTGPTLLAIKMPMYKHTCSCTMTSITKWNVLHSSHCQRVQVWAPANRQFLRSGNTCGHFWCWAGHFPPDIHSNWPPCRPSQCTLRSLSIWQQDANCTIEVRDWGRAEWTLFNWPSRAHDQPWLLTTELGNAKKLTNWS